MLLIKIEAFLTSQKMMTGTKKHTYIMINLMHSSLYQKLKITTLNTVNDFEFSTPL
jgi:hypothetical protein